MSWLTAGLCLQITAHIHLYTVGKKMQGAVLGTGCEEKAETMKPDKGQ